MLKGRQQNYFNTTWSVSFFALVLWMFALIREGRHLLLFLSRSWLSFEDTGVHGLNILHHQTKELVAETKHQLMAEITEGIRKYAATISNNSVFLRMCCELWCFEAGEDKPAGWQRSPGCWTVGWTQQPSCQSHMERSPYSSSAGSQFRLSWHQCTAWSCQSCSWTLIEQKQLSIMSTYMQCFHSGHLLKCNFVET